MRPADGILYSTTEIKRISWRTVHRFITSCICTCTTLPWWSQQEPCVAVIVDQYSAAAALKFILVLNALPRPIQSYCGGPHWGMCGLYTALLQQPAPSVRHQHGRDGWQYPSSLQKSASPPKYNRVHIHSARATGLSIPGFDSSSLQYH